MAYEPELIANALADLHQGMSQKRVAEKYGVSRYAVQTWAKKHPEKALKRDLEPLYAEVMEARLRAELRFYEFLASPDTGPAYMQNQSLLDVAKFLGILADKDILAELARERREVERRERP